MPLISPTTVIVLLLFLAGAARAGDPVDGPSAQEGSVPAGSSTADAPSTDSPSSATLFDHLDQEKQELAREVCSTHFARISRCMAEAWSKRLHLDALLASSRATDDEVTRARADFNASRDRLFQAERDFAADLKEKTGLSLVDCMTPACDLLR